VAQGVGRFSAVLMRNLGERSVLVDVEAFGTNRV
jgi:hypothetical protein